MNPKLVASGVAGLIAAVVVTFVETKVPGLKGMDSALQDLVTGVVTVGSGLVAGYVKSAENWAERYVYDHSSHRSDNLP